MSKGGEGGCLCLFHYQIVCEVWINLLGHQHQYLCYELFSLSLIFLNQIMSVENDWSKQDTLISAVVMQQKRVKMEDCASV